ncbi:MAG: FlgD immunoglobulin-like domain containing protein, partial [Candidatus Fervidibacter sp.]|uniref:FlgD immunoglobulin-like domain containing protein n=2 Tax=Candidatus Fervidibacter sp. TaxID=3100871 RepID=UPI004049F6B2
ISKPPMVHNSVWSAFIVEGEPVAHDFTSERQNRKWNFVVKSDLPDNTPISLRWEGVHQVPKTVALVVTDLATNEKFSLRSRSGYTFLGRKGETRNFLIEVVQAKFTPLVRIASVQSLRGRGLIVRLVSTAPAQIQAEIKTLTGRTVRTLTGAFATQPTSFSLIWDGRDRSGKPLPLGAYLLVVNARDEIGREQRAVRTVMLR